MWLKKLRDFLTKKNNSIEHSNFGRMIAQRFLLNWLTHNYVHIRQNAKLKYDFLNSNSTNDFKLCKIMEFVDCICSKNKHMLLTWAHVQWGFWWLANQLW